MNKFIIVVVIIIIAAGISGYFVLKSEPVADEYKITVAEKSEELPKTKDDTFWIGDLEDPSVYVNLDQWEYVRENAGVMSIHISQIKAISEGRYPTLTHKKLAQTLKDNGMVVSVELCGGSCGWDCDGDSMATRELTDIWPLYQSGVEIGYPEIIRYLAMDAPHQKSLATVGQVEIGGKNCGYTPQQVSNEILKYVKKVKSEMPGVKIGLIEPVPWYEVKYKGKDYPQSPITAKSGKLTGDLIDILDTLIATLENKGERLDFYLADNPYNYVTAHPGNEGLMKLKAIEDYVRSKGVKFAIFYNTALEANDPQVDQKYYQGTIDYLKNYAAVGGKVDYAVPRGWYKYPSKALPETEPYTYMYDVKQFIQYYSEYYPTN